MDKIQEMLIKMLKKSKFFEDLDDERLAEFTKFFKLEMAWKNQSIIIEWHNLENIYVLKKWTLEVKKADGLQSIVLWKIEEWDIFWEMSFLNKKPAMASVVCTSSSADYWKISRSDFEKFLEKNPEVKTKIWQILAKREKENEKKLWWKIFNKTDKKDNLDDIKINL